MTVSINITDSTISLIASIITIGLFLIQVLRFLYKCSKSIYKKVIHKIAEDIAADIKSTVKKMKEIMLLKKRIKSSIRKEVDPAAPLLI